MSCFLHFAGNNVLTFIKMSHMPIRESHCPAPTHVGVWCSDSQKLLSPCERLGVWHQRSHNGQTRFGTGPFLPFTSTWLSNRSSDRVTQRTSMLESTSELLTCFRNTWNWSGARLMGAAGSRLNTAKAQGVWSLQGTPTCPGPGHSPATLPWRGMLPHLPTRLSALRMERLLCSSLAPAPGLPLSRCSGNIC